MLLLVPGRADPEVGAPAGEDVEGGDRLDQQAGVAIGDAGDERPELDPLGARRREGQRAVPFEHLHLGRPDHADLEEVVHHPEAGEPGPIGLLGDPPEGRADLGGATGPGEVRNL